MTLENGESLLYNMTAAQVIDRFTINLIKAAHGFPAMLPAEDRVLVDQYEPLSSKLRCINEAIWWCMDRARDYNLSPWERGMIGIITAFLNDLRDEVKREINEQSGGRREYKYYQQNL